MRNLLAFLAAAVITVAVVGWYLNWYKISTTSGDGRREVKIDLNTPKIGADIEKGGQTLRNALEKAGKKDSPPADPSKTANPITPAANSVNR